MKPIFQISAVAIFLLLLTLPAQGQNLRLNILKSGKLQDSIIWSKQFNKLQNLNKALESYNDSIKKVGYVQFKYGELKAKNDTVYQVKADFGPKFTDIQVKYADFELENYLQKLGIIYKDNAFTIPVINIEPVLTELSRFETQAGFPLTSFQLKNITNKDGILSAELTWKRERKRALDNIVIRGYEKFPVSYLKNYAHLKIGEIYDEEKVINRTELLNNLPFTTQTRSAEVLFTIDSTSLYLYLEKTGANNFDGLLGFRSDEQTGKLKLDGYLNLRLLNNLNYGERLDLEYKSDGNDQQALDLNLELPFLFKSPVGTDVNLNLFRKDTSYSNTRQELSLFYQLNYKTRFTAGILFESSDNLNSSPAQNADIGDYKKTMYTAGFSIMQPSGSVFLPVKYNFKINTAIGERNAINLRDSQILIESLSEYTFSIAEKFKIYTANTTKSLSSDTYITNELFRFGGINNIRGFRENSINANFFTAFRTEMGYVPNKSIYLHTIFDAAYFENKNSNQEELVYSIGLGTRLLTGAGLLNISLANGIQKSNSFKFSNSILHVSIISSF